MNILGIVEFHPLDGTPRGLFLLAQGPAGEFRVPISQDQAVSLLEHGPPQPAPEVPLPDPMAETPRGYADFMESTGLDDDEEEAPLIVDVGGYGMGASEYDDDDTGDL